MEQLQRRNRELLEEEQKASGELENVGITASHTSAHSISPRTHAHSSHQAVADAKAATREAEEATRKLQDAKEEMKSEEAALTEQHEERLRVRMLVHVTPSALL